MHPFAATPASLSLPGSVAALPAASVVLAVAGAVSSLAASWVLVSRIHRVGEHLNISEPLLGLVAALAADGPEVTSAVTAVVEHQRSIGIGVVLGSNVFNLAALFGLGALVAGRLVLGRRAVLLSGTAGLAIGALCVAAVGGTLSPVAATVLAFSVLVPYALVMAEPGWLWRAGGVMERQVAWLRSAVREVEADAVPDAVPDAASDPVGGGRSGSSNLRRHIVGAAVALVVVIGASAVMERAASRLGVAASLPGIVVGGIILAAVTSLPNAVAAVHLAHHRQGAAVLSEAMNSNSGNVVLGLLFPAIFVGLSHPAGVGEMVTGWYVGLTVVALAIAYAGRGIGRRGAAVIVAGYLAFVVMVWVR